MSDIHFQTHNEAPNRVIAQVFAGSTELVRVNATDAEWDLVQLTYAAIKRRDRLEVALKNIIEAFVWREKTESLTDRETKQLIEARAALEDVTP